ncbi:MAG: twin-arginine translocation signal domain-containing protein [Planctomycetota bacterium]
MRSKSISRRDFMKGCAAGASLFKSGSLSGKSASVGENKRHFRSGKKDPWIVWWQYE